MLNKWLHRWHGFTHSQSGNSRFKTVCFLWRLRPDIVARYFIFHSSVCACRLSYFDKFMFCGLSIFFFALPYAPSRIPLVLCFDVFALGPHRPSDWNLVSSFLLVHSYGVLNPECCRVHPRRLPDQDPQFWLPVTLSTPPLSVVSFTQF